MNKKTTRLIVFAVLTLAVLNVVLMFVVWTNKSAGNRRGPKPINEVNAFIIKELGFNEEQAQTFSLFANEHHQNQRRINEAFRQTKIETNQALMRGETINLDSAARQLGKLAERKELEFYRFMSSVLEICNEDQKQRLARVFVEATGIPDYARMPFDRSKPPPPPR